MSRRQPPFRDHVRHSPARLFDRVVPDGRGSRRRASLLGRAGAARDFPARRPRRLAQPRQDGALGRLRSPRRRRVRGRDEGLRESRQDLDQRRHPPALLRIASSAATPIRSRPIRAASWSAGSMASASAAAFFGESMFHVARDASKVALVHLVARLRLGGFRLLDAQFVTPHLASLGAVEISRAEYRARLARGDRRAGRFRGLAAGRADARRRGAGARAERAGTQRHEALLSFSRRVARGEIEDGNDGGRPLRRNGPRDRRHPSDLSQDRALARGHAARNPRLAPRAGRIYVSPHRHHLRRLWRQGRRRAADPVRHRAARDLARRMDAAGGGADPARHRAQPVPEGRLRRARDPEGEHHPARADPAQSVLSPGDDRPPRAARHLGAYRRHRHRARRRRRVLRAGGQRAHALRRLLHAGKPRSDDAADAGPVRPASRRAGRRLSRRSCSPACARSRRAPIPAKRRS